MGRAPTLLRLRLPAPRILLPPRRQIPAFRKPRGPSQRPPQALARGDRKNPRRDGRMRGKSTISPERLYLKLYERGERVFKRHNPCGVEKGTCIAPILPPLYHIEGDKEIKKFSKEHKELSFCCGGCKNLGPNGCTVKALQCKLWICGSLHRTEAGQKAAKEIHVLSQIAWRRGVMPGMRQSMESFFRGERDNYPRGN